MYKKKYTFEEEEEFDISETKKWRNKSSCAMFYFECCLVQRDFFPLDEMCYEEKCCHT